MSGAQEARLSRAVERLMNGQQEALEIAWRALEAGTGARTDDALKNCAANSCRAAEGSP